LAIGIASVVGLVAALVGDGWYNVISWVALGFTIPLMAIAFLSGAE
jgi:hypothetical protein